MNADSTILVRRIKPKARPGFSLLELTLVLAIIGILVAMVAVNIAGAGSRAKTKATKAMLETIATTLKSYHLEYSSYPPTLETLLTVKPPMLDPSKPLKDAWDSAFVYEPRPSGTSPFTLISMGEDKAIGSEDDIPYGVAPQ
jgi:general secretion pathway protein G